MLNGSERKSSLTTLFESREENLCALTNTDKEKIRRLVAKNDTYSMLLEKIDTLSNDEKSKDIVKDSLDSYVDRINLIGAYENEKFYKIGFMDAINLIFECIGKC